MSLWMHLSSFCGTDGTHVHATKPRRASKRKTWDAVCGKRVRPMAVSDVAGNGITLPWPPYVADAREWGLVRCGECMTAVPGRPERLQRVRGPPG